MRRQNGGEKGKVKVRFFEFEVDGDDATVQQGLSAITAALSRAMGSVPPARKVAGALRAAEPASPDLDELDEASLEDAQDPAPSTIAAAGRKRQAPRTPQILNINFNDADPTLKSFMQAKSPASHNTKFLATVAWFNLHGNLQEVTDDHVYTAYRAMEWKSRANMAQPFYYLQGKGWVEKSGAGWKLTHIGLDKANALPGTD